MPLKDIATEEIPYFIVIYFKQNHEKFAFEYKSLTLSHKNFESRVTAIYSLFHRIFCERDSICNQHPVFYFPFRLLTLPWHLTNVDPMSFMTS